MTGPAPGRGTPAAGDGAPCALAAVPGWHAAVPVEGSWYEERSQHPANLDSDSGWPVIARAPARRPRGQKHIEPITTGTGRA